MQAVACWHPPYWNLALIHGRLCLHKDTSSSRGAVMAELNALSGLGGCCCPCCPRGCTLQTSFRANKSTSASASCMNPRSASLQLSGAVSRLICSS